ncbi:MAG: universal stress protein [Woeseiaceae bacterium]|jgi:nucleotide-binding universal stress UspA family protein|nr:universal stress protein [Woeseiaceae bacterium]
MKSQTPFVNSVLHTTDFSPASDRAFAHALAIALLRQTELTILHVGEQSREDIDWDRFPAVRKTLERWGLLEPGSDRSAVPEELGVDVRKLAVKSHDPVRATTKFLDEHPHDLIVLATEGSASAGTSWLHRSDAEAIARNAGAMTLFVPGKAKRDLVALDNGDLNLKRVLIPVDAELDGSHAIEFARRAAEIMGDGDTEMTIFHVGESMPPLPALPEGEGWSWRTDLAGGEPVDAILRAAEADKADLIVMTTNGRDTLGQALAGSTTERVLRRSVCPVLAVPA